MTHSILQYGGVGEILELVWWFYFFFFFGFTLLDPILSHEFPMVALVGRGPLSTTRACRPNSLK